MRAREEPKPLQWSQDPPSATSWEWYYRCGQDWEEEWRPLVDLMLRSTVEENPTLSEHGMSERVLWAVTSQAAFWEICLRWLWSWPNQLGPYLALLGIGGYYSASKFPFHNRLPTVGWYCAADLWFSLVLQPVFLKCSVSGMLFSIILTSVLTWKIALPSRLLSTPPNQTRASLLLIP